jgi:hypothetical protein
MPGFGNAGSLGSDTNTPSIDDGTLALTATSSPGSVGATPSTAPAPQAANTTTDPEIEALDLAPTARAAAYALKKAHPSITFTSGRRNKREQASAMAGNVVANRKWIEETYVASPLRTRCQDWVDKNPDKKTKAEIADGLTSLFDAATDAELGKLSKHLSGEAFDVQPVETDAEAIKTTIRSLDGLDKFLDKEGGLVRWHAQF